MRTWTLSAAALLAAAACSDGDGLQPGGEDAGVADVAPDTGFDAGPFDAGSSFDALPDVGQTDAGFPDDFALFQGETDIEGVDLYLQVRATETSTANPVLILGDGPALGFEYLVEPMEFLLGDDRLVLFVDLPASGRSQEGSIQRPEITLENQYLGLLGALEYFEQFTGEDQPIDVIGHGWGGMMGSLLAARRPELVERLVLVGPWPGNIVEYGDLQVESSSRTSAADNALLRELQSFFSIACRSDIDQCALQIYTIQAQHWVCDGNEEAYDSLEFRHANSEGWFFMDRHLRNTEYDVREEFASITADTTILAGPCDVVPEATLADYEQRIPNAVRIDLEGTGHYPMVEDPARFQALVLDALNEPVVAP
jgi:pimeloyl-ACP methyl ester carboxylesterase